MILQDLCPCSKLSAVANALDGFYKSFTFQLALNLRRTGNIILRLVSKLAKTLLNKEKKLLHNLLY